MSENFREIFLTHCMCQSLQNWLAVDKVTAKNKQAYFFGPPCIYHWMVNYSWNNNILSAVFNYFSYLLINRRPKKPREQEQQLMEPVSTRKLRTTKSKELHLPKQLRQPQNPRRLRQPKKPRKPNKWHRSLQIKSKENTRKDHCCQK